MMKSNRNIVLFFLVIFIIAGNNFGFAQPGQPLRRKLNLIAGKLEFARELQLSFRDKSTVELLNTAEIKLNQARNLVQSHRALMANRMMNEAESAINEALTILLQEPMQRRTRKLDQQIEEAKIVVSNSNNQEAIDLLKKGIENKAIAEQAFREKQFQNAIRYFKTAERQVQRSLDIVQNKDKSIEEKARDEQDQFKQLLARAEPLVSKNSNPTIQRNYRSALRLSREAEQEKAVENYRLAIELHRKATQILLRTIDLAEGKADRAASRAYEEIAATDELIERIRQKIIPIEDDDHIQFYMNHLDQIQDDAHAALAAKNYQLVLLNTRYARDLIEQLHKKVRSDSDVVHRFIDQALNQLELDLNDLKERAKKDGGNIEAEILLTYATQAKTRAEELLERRRYRFAREVILIANRFTFAADRLIRKGATGEIRSDEIFRKIQNVATKLKRINSNRDVSFDPEMQNYFDHVQKMFDLANQNFSKGYYHVANECIEACETALERSAKFFR